MRTGGRYCMGGKIRTYLFTIAMHKNLLTNKIK